MFSPFLIPTKDENFHKLKLPFLWGFIFLKAFFPLLLVIDAIFFNHMYINTQYTPFYSSQPLSAVKELHFLFCCFCHSLWTVFDCASVYRGREYISKSACQIHYHDGGHKQHVFINKPRATSNYLVDGIWTAGRSLDTPVLELLNNNEAPCSS